jgi:uncharacterized tellurite resistance protein B-like protein
MLESTMAILDLVRGFLQRGPLAHDAHGDLADFDLRVATVALLLETAWQDADYESHERRTILRGVEREFGLSRQDAESLMAKADEARRSRDDVESFAAQLGGRYDREQRKRIAALVWKVVYADLVVAKAEVAFATRIALLAGLTPAECQEARERSFAYFSRDA